MNIDDAHKAVDFIRDNAATFAQAKADRIALEEYRKSKKALLMNECEASTVNAREQFAYSHADYIALIEQIKQAVVVEETLKWQMTAAEMRCEVLRSAEATARTEVRATT